MKITTVVDEIGKVEVELEVFVCINCGILHAFPHALAEQMRTNSGSWTCPNGHSQGWFKSEADKLREKLKDAERDREWFRTAEQRARESLAAAEASRRAYKGEVTKLRKRAVNGVCAFCNRHFANVERHVNSKHLGIAVAEEVMPDPA